MRQCRSVAQSEELLYATDASMYQLMPEQVAVPESRKGLLAIVHEASTRRASLIPRGGGTSLVGQSIGSGTVIDCSRHLNSILALNIDEGWVSVEPGLVCGELNRHLKPHGFCFAPDPATLNRATIGGMIANNASGMRSVRYGMTIDHVLEVELALATGEALLLKPLDPDQFEAKCHQEGREGEIYRGIRSLMHTHEGEIRRRYPKVIRRSGGYALDALRDADPFNLAKLICGSEGTLGIILSAKLKLTPLAKSSAVALAHFESVDAALRVLPAIVECGPRLLSCLMGSSFARPGSTPLPGISVLSLMVTLRRFL